MDLFNVRFAVQSAYGFLSTLLYVITVIALVLNWKAFDPYFFRLYIAQFAINVWTYTNSFVTLRIPQNTCFNCTSSTFFVSKSLDESSSFPLNFFYTMHFQFAFVQYITITVIAFNRYTIICFYHVYNLLWKRIWMISIGLAFFPPFLITQEILRKKAYYEYVGSMDCFATRTTADLSRVYSVLIAFIIVTVGLTLLLNVISWVRICTLSRQTRSKTDFNLFHMSFAIFLVQFLLGLVTVVNWFAVNDTNRTSLWAQMGQLFLPFGSDAITLSSPWLLVIFSKQTRKCVRRLFCKSPKVLSTHGRIETKVTRATTVIQ